MINGWLALATTALAAASPAAPPGAPSAVAQTPRPAEPEILTAVRSPGARAVLVNVWATWCDPCRQEMPDLIRFYRDHREEGLRLVLVSADDEENRAEVARVLAEAGLPAETLSFIKRGDDMKFIDGLDRRWSGALPASFLFDGRGRKRHTWAGPVTYRDLDRETSGLLAAPARSETKRSKERTMTFAASVLATALSMAGVLPIGQPAPESHIKMNNAVDGKSKSVSIADVSGKAGTLVIFTCDHCPFARGWEGRIVELGNAYAKQGIGVILINANDPSQHEEDGFAGMQARAKSANMQFPYVVDETSNVARAFGATVTPEAFLFDRHGKLAYHGTVDDNLKQPDQVQKHYLKDALDAVVAGKAPALPETKSLGCGIKYRPSS